jgi:hypothetical protein
LGEASVEGKGRVEGVEKRKERERREKEVGYSFLSNIVRRTNRDSSVVIATGYRLDCLLHSRQKHRFFSAL